MLSVLNADMTKLKTLLSDNLKDFFYHSIRFVFALTYIISINWVLALVSTILTPAIFLLISHLTQPVTKRSEEMQDEIGQVNSLAQDSLSGAMVVKSFNLASILDERFHLANLKALKKGLGVARYWSAINGLSYGLIITPFIIALGLGGYLVIDKSMTFGGMFVFINLLNFVVNPLGNLPNIIASIGEGSGAAQRVFALIDAPAERQDGRVTQPAGTAEAAPAIQFKDVSFAYSQESPILKHVSLSIPRGQTLAIVGPSGGGKTTLLKLILGYYPLPDETVRLFGADLNAWQLDAARRQMAFVAQDTYLFPVSLGENIGCGKPGASQAEIERAARLANIHEFIAGLPEGYATNAGEWGARLSGGQRQRISLARAILKDAPILLLDEPTSALDAEIRGADPGGAGPLCPPAHHRGGGAPPVDDQERRPGAGFAGGRDCRRRHARRVDRQRRPVPGALPGPVCPGPAGRWRRRRPKWIRNWLRRVSLPKVSAFLGGPSEGWFTRTETFRRYSLNGSAVTPNLRKGQEAGDRND